MSGGQRLLVETDVIVDDRENARHPFFREYLAREKGLSVALRRLEAGDFHIPATSERDAILVERKTASDLVSSIIDSRVWSQARRLAEASGELGARPYIVVEGSLERALRFRSVPPTAVSRALEELQVGWGIIIVPTLDEKHTADWLALKARPRKPRATSQSRAILPLAYYKRPRRMSVEERMLYVASSIAGPELGRRLLERFGSLRELVNATPRMLEEVRGVGPQRAQELYLLFNKRWKKTLPPKDASAQGAEGGEE